MQPELEKKGVRHMWKKRSVQANKRIKWQWEELEMRKKNQSGHKNWIRKRFWIYAKTWQCRICFFSSCEQIYTWDIWCMVHGCNVWSFAACINHLYNHKSHAIWMHKTVELRLSFRCTREMKWYYYLIFSISICEYNFFFSARFSSLEWKKSVRFKFVLVISRIALTPSTERTCVCLKW